MPPSCLARWRASIQRIRRQPRSAATLSATTPIPRQERPPRSADRRLAGRDGHVRWRSRRPGRRRDHAGRDRRARRPGGYGQRGRTSDRGHLRTGVRGAAVRVQDGHPDLSADVYRSGLPEEPPGADQVQQGPPGSRGPVELADLRRRPEDRRSIRSGLQGRSGRLRPRSSRACSPIC